MEEIKKFEEHEGQHSWAGTIPSPKKRTLAPLTEAEGPLALLQAEIQRLMKENADLSHRLQQTEGKVDIYLVVMYNVCIYLVLVLTHLHFYFYQFYS